MSTLGYIISKFSLEIGPRTELPVEIPNVGRAVLPEIFRELDFKAGAEIGVKRGHYSARLCEVNPQARIFGVDPYQEYSDYPDVVFQEGFDSWKVEMEQRMSPLSNFTLIQKFSMDAVKEFYPGDLDFVYIDANHALRFVVDDIVEWSRIVRPGGIVAGHDFSRSKPHGGPPHVQVCEAVEAYMSGYHVRPWFVLGRKHETNPVAIRENPRSWFYVVGENIR